MGLLGHVQAAHQPIPRSGANRTIVVQGDVSPAQLPKRLPKTVASPLEQAINGVEGSLYMFSQATADGVMTLTVTFNLGTDVDKAQVASAETVCRRPCRNCRKKSVQLGRDHHPSGRPDLTMVVHLFFQPNGRYDEVYVRNYATVAGERTCSRGIPGAGEVSSVRFRADYAMRVLAQSRQSFAARKSHCQRW